MTSYAVALQLTDRNDKQTIALDVVQAVSIDEAIGIVFRKHKTERWYVGAYKAARIMTNEEEETV